MKLVVIDGQGGRMGSAVIGQLKAALPEYEIYAMGTNSTATAAMLRAGADYGATGENPVLVNAADADIIIGPMGIVLADSLLGEVTPAMACAVGRSRAYKLLLPVNRCNHHVIGCPEIPLTEAIRLVIGEVKKYLQKTDCSPE